MKQTFLLDTNILLRVLLNDDEQQVKVVVGIFERAEAGEFILEVTDVTVAEVVWVLHYRYKIARPQVVEPLIKLLDNPGIHCAGKRWLIRALESFRDKNVDAPDCFLAEFAAEEGKPVLSFDKHFKRFPSVTWQPPEKL